MADGKTIIYTPESVDFSVGGTKYGVTYINLSLAKNAIPMCRVGIAPDYGKEQTKVYALSVKTLKDTFSQLVDKATRLETSNLSVTLKANGGGSDQKLNLSGWVLSSCGLFRVSTTSVFNLECTIAHPAYKTTLHEGWFHKSAAPIDLDDESVDGVTDPLNAAVVAGELLDGVNEGDASLDPMSDSIDSSTEGNDESEIAQKMLDMSKTALSEVSQYLTWDAGFSDASNDMPCDDVLSEDQKGGVKRALVDAWLEGGCNATIWGRLTDTVCSWFQTEIIPSYDEAQLKVTPVNPWRSSQKVTLNDDYVYAVDLPGHDPNPVYGVVMDQVAGSAPQDAVCTFDGSAQQQVGIQPAELAYIPAGADESAGKLLHMSDPDWIVLAMSHSAAKETPTTTFDQDYDDADEEPESAPGGENEDLSGWNAARVAVMAGEFFRSYRREVAAHCQCALSVTDGDGNIIYPGKRLQYKTGGETLFSGEIEVVEHNIDCVSSMAQTMINVAYCDVDGKAAQLIGGSSIKIPMYQATGSGD